MYLGRRAASGDTSACDRWRRTRERYSSMGDMGDWGDMGYKEEAGCEVDAKKVP